MKINVTAQQLLNMHTENLRMQGSVLYYYNLNKINAFNQNNSIRVNSLLEKQQALYEEYFVIENGKIKQHTVKTPIETIPDSETTPKQNLLNQIIGKTKQPHEPQFTEKQEPLLKEGKTLKDAEIAIQTFLSQIIPIEV